MRRPSMTRAPTAITRDKARTKEWQRCDACVVAGMALDLRHPRPVEGKEASTYTSTPLPIPAAQEHRPASWSTFQQEAQPPRQHLHPHPRPRHYQHQLKGARGVVTSLWGAPPAFFCPTSPSCVPPVRHAAALTTHTGTRPHPTVRTREVGPLWWVCGGKKPLHTCCLNPVNCGKSFHTTFSKQSGE